MTARELVLNMLQQVNEEDKFCHQVLNQWLSAEETLSAVDRAFATKLFHGTLERQLTIDWILERQTGRPISKQKSKIRNLLRLSVYQVLFLSQVPNSAACNEAVKIAKQKGFTGLSGFVNGVLRAIARNVEMAGGTKEYLDEFALDMTGTDRLSFLYSMPSWLVLYWTNRYPAATVETMLSSFLQEGRTILRWNQSLGNMEELERLLAEDGAQTETAAYCANARKLVLSGKISELRAYQQGRFAIQDESSILAGNLLPLAKDMLVLDLCGAPGGKTIHAADDLLVLGGGSVVSRDVSDRKIKLIRDQAKHFHMENVQCQVMDASKFDKEMKDKCDLVIADLPCSGIGVIGRKPDIKWKTSYDDFVALAEIQRAILNNAVKYVKKGGYLSYSTCTIAKEENEDNYEYIKSLGLTPVSLSERLPEALRSRETDEGRLQLLPGVHNTDGFFISLFRKE